MHRHVLKNLSRHVTQLQITADLIVSIVYYNISDPDRDGS